VRGGNRVVQLDSDSAQSGSNMANASKDIDLLYGLDPVIEPGEEAGSDALERFVDIGCPYCGEQISTRVDLSAGAQSYIEDCQVCCQPMILSVTVTDQGEFLDIAAERAGQ
jgi:hypothetical protein